MRIKIHKSPRKYWRNEEPKIIEVCHIFKGNRRESMCTCPSIEGIPPDKLHIATTSFSPVKFKCSNCKECGVVYIEKKNKNKITIGPCDEC